LVITWGTLAATLAAPFVLLLPGGMLLALLLPPASFEAGRRPDAVTWLALAAGLTLALTPVGLLILYLVGIRIGTSVALAVLGVSAVAIAWQLWPSLRAWGPARLSWRERLAWLDAPLVALVLVLALVLGVRLWVVRGVNAGFWGDSYQHTLIAQLILDHGGLFQSWLPYVPLESFTYHFGFHGNVALFQWASDWLTGNSTPRTVVLVGQFLNALAALSLYPLAVRLSGGRRWSGVLAVLVAGLLMPTPMIYANWGRYTQLAGQVILPVALWLTMEAVEAPRWDGKRMAVAALAVAGLGLTHYRVALFYVAFLLPYVVYRLILARRAPRQGLASLGRLAAVGCVAGVLVSPWLWHLQAGLLPSNLAQYQEGALPQGFRQEYNALDWQFLPFWSAGLSLAGIVWAFVRRQQAVPIAFWVAILLLIANLPALGMPDLGLFNNFAVLIALYMPAALLAGTLAGDLLALGAARWRLVPTLGVVSILILGLAGAGQQATGLDRSYQLVTQADEQAMTWIGENTPADAKFLVNSFFAFGDYAIVGSDAGWWIPLLTGRGNTVPPATYTMERANPADYREEVNALAHRVEEGSLDDPATVRYLQARGISYVYVGQVGGPLLDPDLLRRSPFCSLVYDRDGVSIFALR
jgi:hypothetical protein